VTPRSIRRILVANRGEIAVRIIATCQRLGIETALAASAADLESMPARLADRTLCIGPAAPASSYLDVAAIVRAALETGADAIHPGYGFLSENPRLAEACSAQGLVFIGPTAAQLEAVGDKLRAREHALAAGLAVVPGGAVRTQDEARELASHLGWPVILKAVGGGGGRGMRPAHGAPELDDVFDLAVAEADASFDDPRLYLERYVRRGRHIEVQLLGDGRRVVHAGDRDCSIQRRYQKLVEEAPAPGLDDGLRTRMHDAAVRFGEHLAYRGAGTVEFLVDTERGTFYFLEMNARIQVEHPVTEAVTGLDLVAEQIAIAEGRPLGDLGPNAYAPGGHAIECRLNAENWRDDFRPSPGTIRSAVFAAGPGIRVDTHVHAGARVPPHYDSLLAKLIVHAADRAQACALLSRALSACSIDGVATNIDLHRALAASPDFRRGAVDAEWLPAFLAARRETRA
jgi:acetyl-CoA carboxylase biotin carboxylase subunit